MGNNINQQTLTEKNKNSRISILFYCFWFLIGLIQAWGTELFDDEAYYWVYSKFMDWGYFDHPPMIALLIKIGYSIFPSELGVRLFIVILGTASIYYIEKLTKPKDLKLFYSIVLSMAILQLGGVMAVPDIPLFFFTVMFFVAYQKYDEHGGFKEAFFLSIVISLLLYSKYHGILIVLFTLLSNLSILKKPLTYLVIFFSVILFMPHIIWQYQHGFPTIYYHLFERVSSHYDITYTTDFILGQFLIAGPFVGWLIIWSALKCKPENHLEKAMYWSLIGIYTLFFLSSFKSRTEANWTIPVIAPLIVLSYHTLYNNISKAKWIFRLLPYSLIIVFLVRVYMFLDIAPIKFMPKDEFHQNKKWAISIKKQAGSLPVVFTNSYQRASKYWFYTGDTSFSLNTFKYRRSNYNFWPLEGRLQNKKILLVESEDKEKMKGSNSNLRTVNILSVIDSFQSHSQLIFSGTDLTINQNGIIQTTLSILKNNAQSKLDDLTDCPEIILVIYRLGDQLPLLVKTGNKIYCKNKNRISIRLTIPNLQEKKYTICWALSNSFSEPTINSRPYTLINNYYVQ